MTVTADFYDVIDEKLYFTIKTIPFPPNPTILSSITVQRSEDNFVTHTDFSFSFVSPCVVSVVDVNTKFRIKLEPNGELSNILNPALVDDLDVDPIDNENKIIFCNSPVFIRRDISSTTSSLIIKLFIWNGSILDIPSVPNHILKKSKVSPEDTYISLEISGKIKPYINPQFAYNRASPPAITDQGVFILAEVTETYTDIAPTITVTPVLFAVLGYRWNYEQNLIGNNGVANYGNNGFLEPVDRWYNPKIHNYFFQDFNLTQPVEIATTSNIIRYNSVTPPSKWLRCTLDSSLIVFLNKLGLWEQFTPHGKKTISSSIKRTDSNVSHRDPSQVDNTYIHSRVNTSLEVKQSYIINSGSMNESMTSIIEELIYSPKVYLINFKGDFEETTTVGLTIDNTYITIDNTFITIDATEITEEALGYFKTHQQIPVIVVDEDFTRKTRLNNKNDIDYNVKLDETNNKINSIL